MKTACRYIGKSVARAPRTQASCAPHTEMEVHVDLKDIKIDPEFEAEIPPLTEEEFNLLKQNILSEGRLLSPLIIWNGTIVDGHNRYRILLEHPEIDYETLNKDFPDRFAASAWICKNQLGRRNLTPEQRVYLIGKQYS